MTTNKVILDTCDICGTTEDVITTNTVWGTWGGNAFDFNWSKHIGKISLCPDCEGECNDAFPVPYVLCRDCDAAIPSEDVGYGYLESEDDYPDDECPGTICPDCAVKRGIKCECIR